MTRQIDHNQSKPKMLRHPERISYDALKEKISSIKPLRLRALACLAYATGARASELIKITKQDIRYETTANGTAYMVVTTSVLKKRDGSKEYFRHVPIRMTELWLVQPIREWILSCETNVLFPYRREYIYMLLMQTIGINPHGFRKLRASHLVQEHNFNAHQLKTFFSWASVNPSDYYVRLNLKDIMY